MRGDPKKDLEADVRNKLSSPRVVLEHILMEGKIPDRKLIEKAISCIDRIPPLIEEWFKKNEVKE